MNYRIVWFLYFALFVYNVIDTWQTHLLIKVGLIEANPVLSMLMGIIGFHAITVMKTAFLLMMGVFMFLDWKQERREN